MKVNHDALLLVCGILLAFVGYGFDGFVLLGHAGAFAIGWSIAGLMNPTED